MIPKEHSERIKQEAHEEESITEKIERLGVYCEKSFNNQWCYKHQFPGQDIVIVSNPEKEKAASGFFIVYLQSLHYAIRYLFEEKRFEELKKLIEKMQSYDEPNVNKTIEIVMRSGIAEALAKYNNSK